MKNQFFRAIRYVDNDMYEVLACIHIKCDKDIWEDICNNHSTLANNSVPFHINLKYILSNEYNDIYMMINDALTKANENIDDPDIQIWLASSNDYRRFDKQYDNERSFIEYVNTEIGEYDRHRKIIGSILLDAGFEDVTPQEMENFYKDEVGANGYSAYQIIVDDIKIDISTFYTNNERDWHVHIDNCDCDTIGHVDIDTVWQFNMLMEVFGSSLRL